MKPYEDSNFSPYQNDGLDDSHAFQFVSKSPEGRIDGSFLTKMIVGAVSLTAIVAIGAVKVMVKTHGEDAKIDPLMASAILASSASVGAILGAVLALKDWVQRKLENGKPVTYFLRLLFGSGGTSLAIWIAWIVFTVLVVIPVVLSLNAF